ncbi:hypothetical protein CKM354_000125900 [Cercospora kikuchii]|uniref:Uncharacterized protein n=1 Tax=Cercospora kikuchii TaxID=84275 RepID=A0A9P3C7X1_9PEZI|nr:uncharacterized protein CKM354_000125900 [Cercospora kikuchii]GIZ37826.1 hypothetical protein CKM354_000125900 [Cercospora kikuchii]
MAGRYESISPGPRSYDAGAMAMDSSGSDKEQESEKYESIEPGRRILTTRPWPSTLGMQLASILWLAPIIALLYLNFKNHEIGQSAWCPGGGSCNNGTYDANPGLAAQNALKYSKESRDLLGSLQLVAKALEIWFALIALWFVYLFTMRMASKDHGVPVEYLTRAYRLGEFFEIFRPRTWTSLSSKSTTRNTKESALLWIFVITSVVVSLLCVLMGPATAVLVLPTQQWLETKDYVTGQLKEFNAASPPSVSGFLLGQKQRCSDQDVQEKRWSCISPGSSYRLDYWLVSSIFAGRGIQFSEAPISFASNMTDDQNYRSPVPVWVPNRQLLWEFTYDEMYYKAMQTGTTSLADLNDHFSLDEPISEELYQRYRVFEKAIELENTREGPILGLVANQWPAPEWVQDNDTPPDGVNWIWTTTVDENRQVRCYPVWAMQNSYWNQQYENLDWESVPVYNNYTRCIQVGSGWGPNTKNESFTIEHPLMSANSTNDGPEAEIRVYSSDRTAFLPNGTLPSGMDPDCLRPFIDEPVPFGVECDWEQFFAIDNSSVTANMSRFANTVELQQRTSNLSTSAIYAIDYMVLRNNTLYAYIPSSSVNQLSFAETRQLPQLGAAIPVNPEWFLATWAVDSGGTIPVNRSTALIGLTFSQAPGIGTLAVADTGDFNILQSKLLQSLQYMLTMLDYTVDAAPKAIDKSAMDRPPIIFKTRYYTWTYSMSSRTSKFAAAIAIMGMIIAIATTVFAGVDTEHPYRSLTDIVISALEHIPDRSREFGDGEMTRQEAARVSYKVVSSESLVGGLRYEGVDTAKLVR